MPALAYCDPNFRRFMCMLFDDVIRCLRRLIIGEKTWSFYCEYVHKTRMSIVCQVARCFHYLIKICNQRFFLCNQLEKQLLWVFDTIVLPRLKHLVCVSSWHDCITCIYCQGQTIDIISEDRSVANKWDSVDHCLFMHMLECNYFVDHLLRKQRHKMGHGPS